MALFGTFQFGTGEQFGTGSSGGGGVGPYMDYTVTRTMASADEVLDHGKRIEIRTGTKWDDVIAPEWVIPAADNARRDDRPIPHPDWP